MHAFLLAVLLAAQLQNPTGVVAGQIRLSNGMPAVGIRVSAILAPEPGRSNNADAGALFSQTQTDDTGHYRLESIPPGRYYIAAGRVDAPTYYPGKTDTEAASPVSVLSSAPIEGIDFTITESSARVPNTPFGFVVIPNPINIPVVVKLQAESGGRFPIMSVHGRILMNVRPTQTTFQMRTPAGNLGTTAGVIVNIGSSFTSSAFLQADGTMNLRVATGELRFSVVNLPDDYEVKSMWYDSTDLLRDPLKVVSGPLSSDIQVTVGLKNPMPPRSGKTVRGRVFDGIIHKEWIAESVSLSSMPGTIFSDASFEFADVPPGRYTLQAREGLPGDRTAQTEVIVESSDVTADLTYTSVPTYVRVAGRIVVEGGAKLNLAGSRIQVSSTGSTPIAVASDGTFKTALQEGAYRVSIDGLPVGYALKSISSGFADLLKEPLRIEPGLGPVAPDVIVVITPIRRFTI
jgi:hypothetical protein